MPPKKERRKGRTADERERKTPAKTQDVAICGNIIPGPQYQLKSLVGYWGHCISRFRNPAYSFGRRQKIFEDVSEGPGPKYLIKDPKPTGFTFAHALRRCDVDTGPGPYKLPDVRGLAFSLKWRSKPRKGIETPGPYYIKPIAPTPAFSIGLRTPMAKVADSTGPYPPYKVDAIKPKAPMFTIASRGPLLQDVSMSPGPIYLVKPPKPTPAFSFGVRHSKCAPPYITECDDQC